jgi:hypothetical protein
MARMGASFSSAAALVDGASFSPGILPIPGMFCMSEED